MALISCPECKAQVSDHAAACIRCGFPLVKKSDTAGSSTPPKSLLEGNPAYDKQASTAPGRFLDQNPNYSWSSPSSEAREQHSSAPQVIKTAKSRGIYIILGLFFGLLGIHNFYAGYLGRGFIQLLLVAVLGWFVVGLVIVGIWVIVELFTINKDAAGDAMV